MRDLIQDMGGSHQDLQIPHTARRSGEEGEGEEGRETAGDGEGGPPPLGWRRTPDEQVRVLFNNTVNTPPGRIPPSGQAPATHRW